mmetsp:Transcript_29179/g.36133  ORF Transcript_29179/g.36133 Transcript_29179/m.36133 type:complete len:221 (-) Transcript_29179:476-1138(-)
MFTCCVCCSEVTETLKASFGGEGRPSCSISSYSCSLSEPVPGLDNCSSPVGTGDDVFLMADDILICVAGVEWRRERCALASFASSVSSSRKNVFQESTCLRKASISISCCCDSLPFASPGPVGVIEIWSLLAHPKPASLPRVPIAASADSTLLLAVLDPEYMSLTSLEAMLSAYSMSPRFAPRVTLLRPIKLEGLRGEEFESSAIVSKSLEIPTIACPLP